MGFSVWLAILSLLASIHADVFEQEDNPLIALFIAPVKRLWPGHPVVDLSSLLSAGGSQPGTAQASPLYIFMLDLSISMRDQSVSVQEVGRYLQEIGASSYSGSSSPVSECLVREGDAKGIDIARSELCRYIDSLPLNARAALWSFGNSPKMVMPSEGSPSGEKYVLIEDDRNGGNSRRRFFPLIRDLEANQEHTDFDRLLADISGKYRQEIESEQEVHFVVISDFVHDIGGKQSEKDSHLGIDGLEDSIWQSRYRASLFSIGDRLREMSRTPGKTFHLAVVRGARRAICSVLPVATESFGWDDYRELRLESQAIGSEFDFLNAYQETDTPITFYYTPGSAEPEPLIIKVDSEKYKDAKLRIGLASRVSTSQSFPLDVRVSIDDEATGFARIGQSFAGEVGREGDKITLQPQSVISPREATAYRLLFSWQKDRKSQGEESAKRTFTAPVVFKRQLSFHGALAMVGSIAAVFWFLGRMMNALWHLYRLRRSEQDQEAGPEGMGAARVEVPMPAPSPTPPAQTSSVR